jgi:hypothetical protein
MDDSVGLGRYPRWRTRTLATGRPHNRTKRRLRSRVADIHSVGVWNLSTHALSDGEIELLSRGLGFSPTPWVWPPSTVDADITEFCRKIRLAYHFSTEKNRRLNRATATRKYPFPTGWTPGFKQGWVYGEVWMERFTKELKRRITAGKPSSFNLSPRLRNALRRLRGRCRRGSIILKKADKGSAVVIADRADYREEGLRQMRQTAYYEPIPESIAPSNAEHTERILQKMQVYGVISESELSFLRPPPDYKHRLAYWLFKIHKERRKWWTTSSGTQIPQGRPIVSNVGTETAATAKYLDFYLQPSTAGLPALVRDSYDFVDRLDRAEIVSEHVVFMTADIADLYTNISQAEALHCMSGWIRAQPDLTPAHQDGLIGLLMVQLFGNDIEFDGQFYRQVKGISMGWSPAPTVANFVLKGLDELILSFEPLLYARFIDDVILVWDSRKVGLERLVAAVDAWKEGIVLVWQRGEEQAVFLDVEVYKDGPGRLRHRVYFKPTDTHAVLHRHSCHAAHTFPGIVKSQLVRFFRLCSDMSEALKASNLLFAVLRKRGYSQHLLTATLDDVTENYLAGHLLAGPSSQNDDDDSNGDGDGHDDGYGTGDNVAEKRILPLAVPYSPELRQLGPWIHEQYRELWSRLPANDRFLPEQITVAWRKNGTLKDALVRAAFLPDQTG